MAGIYVGSKGVALWLIGGLALACLAQFVPLAPAQVLHEPVIVPQLRCQDATCRREGLPASSLPEAVVSSEGLIGAPAGGRNPEQNEKIYGSDKTESPLASGAPPPNSDPPPVRRGHVQPDAETGPEPPGERRYHEVFNPAVFPYKRMTVVDAVGDDGALIVHDGSSRPLPLGDGRVQRGRDPFYASVVVDFVGGQRVALPTPAAGIRLVSYRATPERDIRFQTDGADNLFALTAQGGRHRLVYLMDVAPRYFAGPLFEHEPRAPRLLDVPRAQLNDLPRRYQREAATVLRHLRVRPAPTADYAETLGRLVEYFRGFTLGELDSDSEERAGESMYLKLALQKRGACRHRSYAFVITALAAGIPARYVENELHVFVEVYVPLPSQGTGYWRRINLGGAPLQQRVVEGENKVAYHEKGGDPFPRPAEFQGGPPPKVAGLPPKGAERRRGEGGGRGGDGGGDGLPRLDGPEDRARRGEGGNPDPTDAAGKGPAKGSGSPAEAAGAQSGAAGKSGAAAAKTGSGPGEAGVEPAKAGQGGAGGKTDPMAPGESGQERGEEAAPEFPADDDIGQFEDRRREPASEPLLTTQITLEASAAHGVYRGMAIPVRGQVRSSRGNTAGLQVILLLAIPGAPQAIGRAFTTADGSYQTEVEIPAGVPLGKVALIARVKGDQTRRGSSTGRYDRPVER